MQVRTLCWLGDGVWIKPLSGFIPGHNAPESDKLDQLQQYTGTEEHGYAFKYQPVV